MGGRKGSDVKPFYTAKDMKNGKVFLHEAEMQKLVEEDPELFKRRAQRTREEFPKFAKAI